MIVAALNIAALVLSVCAALLMYFYPSRIETYTEDGRRIVDWVGEPTEEGKARGRWQLRLARFSPLLLALGLLLQLPAALVAFCYRYG